MAPADAPVESQEGLKRHHVLVDRRIYSRCNVESQEGLKQTTASMPTGSALRCVESQEGLKHAISDERRVECVFKLNLKKG